MTILSTSAMSKLAARNNAAMIEMDFPKMDPSNLIYHVEGEIQGSLEVLGPSTVEKYEPHEELIIISTCLKISLLQMKYASFILSAGYKQNYNVQDYQAGCLSVQQAHCLSAFSKGHCKTFDTE